MTVVTVAMIIVNCSAYNLPSAKKFNDSAVYFRIINLLKCTA